MTSINQQMIDDSYKEAERDGYIFFYQNNESYKEFANTYDDSFEYQYWWDPNTTVSKRSECHYQAHKIAFIVYNAWDRNARVYTGLPAKFLQMPTNDTSQGGITNHHVGKFMERMKKRKGGKCNPGDTREWLKDNKINDLLAPSGWHGGKKHYPNKYSIMFTILTAKYMKSNKLGYYNDLLKNTGDA